MLDKKVFYYYKVDNKEYITYLFLVNLKVFEIFHSYYNFVLLDCTYTSNLFKIPLFNIVGVNTVNKTIVVAFNFIKAKKKANYL